MKSTEHGKLILWEIVLLLSSIPVFRSVWYFLDRFQWAGGTAGLFLLLAAGLMMSAAALHAIQKERQTR